MTYSCNNSNNIIGVYIVKISANVEIMSKNITWWFLDNVNEVFVELEYNGHAEDLEGQAENSGFIAQRADHEYGECMRISHEDKKVINELIDYLTWKETSDHDC